MEVISKKLQEKGFVIPDFKKSNFQVMNDIVEGKNSQFTGDRENKILIVVDGFGSNLLNELQSKQFPSGKQIVEDLHGVEYSTIEDLREVMRSIIRGDSHSNMLVYYGDLDHIEHMHGYMSEESIAEANRVVELLGSIYHLARDKDYNIVVTADHGHVIVKDCKAA